MVLSKLRGLFTWRKQSALPARTRLTADRWPAVVYAVGDIHGCVAELRLLEAAIVDDSAHVEGEKWIVYLGDYIDRGPDSAGVLDRLIAHPPQGFQRICLTGNHELMMLDYVQNPRPTSGWLSFGGMETLNSYGISSSTTLESARIVSGTLASHIPNDHLTFLAELPLMLNLPGVTFVHAGLRPGIPLDEQREEDLVFIRDAFFEAPPWPDRLVVHGHTPAAEPVIAPGRICIDTAAFATGRLTAVRLAEGEASRMLSVMRK